MQASILIRDTGVKVTEVLRMISQGYSLEQILETHQRLVPGDIRAAACFALDLIEQHVTADETIELDHSIKLTARNGKIINLTKLRESHPRAYEPWTTNEEEQLSELFKRGAMVAKIAEVLKRQPGAVRTRLQKLSLVSSPNDSENKND